MSFVDKIGKSMKKNFDSKKTEKDAVEAPIDKEKELENGKELEQELKDSSSNYSELEKEYSIIKNENSELKTKYNLAVNSLKQKTEELDNVLLQNKREIQSAMQNAEYDYSKKFISSIASEFDILFKMLNDIKDNLSEKNKEAVDGLRNKFEKAFAQVGVTFITPKCGDTFNSEMHQAITQKQTTACQSGQIFESLSSYWKIGDRTVKTALVIIAE